MARFFYFAGYLILLIICIVLITFSETLSSGDADLKKSLLGLGIDSFKLILGAVIGAMGSMLAGYLTYKQEKAAIVKQLKQKALDELPPNEAAKLINSLDE